MITHPRLDRTAPLCHGSEMVGRTYRLEVEGELSDPAVFAFEGISLRHAGGNTLLTGAVRDQAELHGLLQHVGELGLTLVSLNPVEPAWRN